MGAGLAAALLAAGGPSWADRASPWGLGTNVCAPESVGVDTSQADRDLGVGALDGEAPGETFSANDTLIGSISVWRPAVQANDPDPMKLWITEVDSTGMPLTDRVVLDGPAIQATGDGIHPTEVRYGFSPPVALPHRGRFFFAIQELCYGYFDLLSNTGDAYLGGDTWRTGRSYLSGCSLRPYPDKLSNTDLIFTIVFCSTTTPVRTNSWGQLKLRYR